MLAKRALAACALLLALSGCPQPVPTAAYITVDRAWAERWVTPGGEVGIVIFMEVTNKGGRDDRLLGARSDILPRVGIYRLTRHSGRLRWIPLKAGIPLPAGEEKELSPFQGTLAIVPAPSSLRVGSRFSLALEFERSAPLVVQVTVVRERDMP